jgi:hypothetical protein
MKNKIKPDLQDQKAYVKLDQPDRGSVRSADNVLLLVLVSKFLYVSGTIGILYSNSTANKGWLGHTSTDISLNQKPKRQKSWVERNIQFLTINTSKASFALELHKLELNLPSHLPVFAHKLILVFLRESAAAVDEAKFRCRSTRHLR